MIELKDITTKHKEGKPYLDKYSRIINNGEYLRLGKRQGEMVIKAILGFLPLESGFVTFDGMPLSENSALFLRKMVAYVPSPEGFDNVDDPAQKQVEMVEEAVNSDSDIILAIDPVSHQGDEMVQRISSVLHTAAGKGKIVVVATDRTDI